MSDTARMPDASASPASPSRRGWLVAAGAAGLAAGAGFAWWRSAHGPAVASEAPVASGGLLPGEALPAHFWAQRFETPAGPPLLMSTLQGRGLVLNFWATWCPPCVKEMPDLDRFHRAMKDQGWQVLGLAIDSPAPVKAFLQRTPVGFPIGLAGMDGTSLAQALGNAAGGLPFTVVIDARGRLRQRKMGATHLDELHQWARELR